MGSDQKRAIVAVVLSGIILFGWQYFFAPAPSSMIPAPSHVEIEAKAPIENSPAAIKKDTPTKTTFTLKNDKTSITLSNDLDILEYHALLSGNTLKDLFEEDQVHSIDFLFDKQYEKLIFEVTTLSDTKVKLENFENSLLVEIELLNNGKINYNFTSPKPFYFKFIFKTHELSKSSHNKREFVYLSDKYKTIAVGDDEKNDLSLKWFGLNYNYHLFANILSEKSPVLFSTTKDGELILTSTKAAQTFSFSQIFSKKEYDLLQSLGDNLHLSVDFGMWAIVAVPILRGLQFFFTIFPNYGISIILLTLLIRTLTFPLQYKSYKSMKKMQIIQPEITKIREKYKSDPQRLQQETMALFKKAGANPLGGCLPLLLQMPIFFAFYQVLYSAVELVDAPFYFWIHDLSEKDPYYVLPILMSLAMFLQQKLTPATSVTDPMQQKVLMFMPLIFGLIMKDLPSGLTLYIFVSTVFGMAQQLFVYKRVS